MQTSDGWYETGDDRTDKCGCVWREVAPSDGHCEPVWVGQTICPDHLVPIQRHAQELAERLGGEPSGSEGGE